MRVDLGAIYDDTITIVNKVDAKDAGLPKDAYVCTVIDHCMWSLSTETAIENDGTVNISTVHKVQIPEDETYQPYRDWVQSKEGFTVRRGDYVFLGAVDEPIESATQLRKVAEAYEPDVFQVQTFRDLTKGEGFEHSTDGVFRFLEVYYIEG